MDVNNKDKEQQTTAPDTNPDTTDKAIETAEKAGGQFDKERQRADQAEANLRKARVEKEQLSGELATIREQSAKLQRQIDELNAGKTAADDIAAQVPEVDPENARPEDYANAIKGVKTLLVQQGKELAALKAKTSQTEQERQQERAATQAERAKEAVLNKVCQRLETKYGNGLRNRAIELMQARTESEGAPANPAEATLMLDDCFAEAKAEREKEKSSGKKKGETPIDRGGGGSRPHLSTSTIKPGSLDEVAAQFAKAAAG